MRRKIKLYYYQAPLGNVGDDLNAILWSELLGDVFSDSSEETFIGIGSILDNRYQSDGRKIVFGTGARDPTTTPIIQDGNWDVRFVRGPNTASALHLDESYWISDPAIVFPRVFPQEQIKDKTKIGFVPYFRSNFSFTSMICANAGLEHIPSTLSPRKFIQKLTQCSYVFCEAMHGAILADAYRIPWIPCRISNFRSEGQTHLFKWQDWMRSLNLDASFLTLPTIWSEPGEHVLGDLKLLLKCRHAAKLLRGQIRSSNWVLSEATILDDRTDRILTEAANLRRDLN